jgi:hypothetical protein
VATASPQPELAVKPARDYVPGPGELPVGGLQYTAKYGHGAPLPSDYLNGASDTWEVIYDGPGAKRVIIDVYVMANSTDAASLASGFGTPDDLTKAKDVATTALGRGATPADVYREPVANGSMEFWSVSWSEGRVAFQISDRDRPGVLSRDDALEVARVVDARAQP